MTEPLYSFRAPTRADLPLLLQWLRAPEVRHWWGDPAQEIASIEEDLDGADMRQWIVSVENRPFAYAQAYEIEVWPQAHFADLPPGASAIDAFIGEPGMIGRGHGGRFLRALAERLLGEGAPLVAIDPDADNIRARRAYRNAGFEGETVVETPAGPVVPMIFRHPRTSAP